MYGAIKKVIRILSPSPAAPKCPISYLEVDDTDLQVYVAALFNCSFQTRINSCQRSGGV
jgi:hypothetical protein